MFGATALEQMAVENYKNFILNFLKDLSIYTSYTCLFLKCFSQGLMGEGTEETK